jgi:cellulose synthase/poly-beta-1,6-N-acetylglucosamine synthase-like glycosyltransferase
MKVALIILLGISFYAYALYPVIIWVLARLRTILIKGEEYRIGELPEITLFVTAFNEERHVDEKVQNSLQLNYPKEKLKLVWVTDGSDDNTNELLRKYQEVEVHFKPERKGKMHAMNRGVGFVESEIIVFSDGNTVLGKDTLMEIARMFANPKVGCVAGEKRVMSNHKDGAAASGEGFYWKYESFIKKHDAIAGSTVGAAGELFAVRRNLFEPVEHDTILDDFIISLRIAGKGYKIDYSPDAFASESASVNVKEEMKRKIRIAAGSFQAFGRLLFLFNIFKRPMLAFQYLSHKVLRWIVVPFALPVVFVLNGVVALEKEPFWAMLFAAQVFFYLLVALGLVLQNKKIKSKILFVPYYFFVANFSQWKGFFRYLKKQQSVNWERAQRA